MAKIKPNQDFLHGQKKFKKGRTYDVPDSQAYYFAGNGWLEGAGVTDEGEVTLEIQDGESGYEGGNVGG